MSDIKSKFEKVEKIYTENKVQSILDDIESEVSQKNRAYEKSEVISWKRTLKNTTAVSTLSLIDYIMHSCGIDERDVTLTFDSELQNALTPSESKKVLSAILTHFKDYRGFKDFIRMGVGVTSIEIDSVYLYIDVYTKNTNSIRGPYVKKYLSSSIPHSFNVAIKSEMIRGVKYHFRRLECRVSDVLRISLGKNNGSKTIKISNQRELQ